MSALNMEEPPLLSLEETPKNQQETPSWMALIGGACAGMAVDITLYPIDTIKTRLQSSQGFWKSGGFRGIFQGLSAVVVGSAPGAALFFCSYETCKPWIHKNILHSNKELNKNPLTHMLSASVGEITACLIRVPTEVVKQRMQIGEYNAFGGALKHIYTNYKLRGFYVGYGSTVAREIPFSFIQFPLWERLKILWSEYFNDNQPIHPWQGALCGSFAGAFAAGITTPLDVIKTRLMLRVDKNGYEYKGFVDCAKRIYSEEQRIMIFYRGIVPRSLWIFAGGFFFFGAYEKTTSMLRAVS